jgi:hypothetical protein
MSQYSPKMKNPKKITIAECLEAMKTLKGHKPTSSIQKHIQLEEPQKRFLWCVVNKY